MNGNILSREAARQAEWKQNTQGLPLEWSGKTEGSGQRERCGSRLYYRWGSGRGSQETKTIHVQLVSHSNKKAGVSLPGGVG